MFCSLKEEDEGRAIVEGLSPYFALLLLDDGDRNF